MGDWARIAHIEKPKGKKGSVVVRSADGLPFVMRPGMEVRLVPPTLRGPRGACVREVAPMGDGRFEVAFEGVDGIEAAEGLVGQWCLVPAEEASRAVKEAVGADALAGALWRGFRVVDDAAGELGRVKGARPGAAQDLLEVFGERFGEVLIPQVPEFVRDVDFEAQVVFVSVPDGLLSLGRA